MLGESAEDINRISKSYTFALYPINALSPSISSSEAAIAVPRKLLEFMMLAACTRSIDGSDRESGTGTDLCEVR
jgi:hypothetical protein